MLNIFVAITAFLYWHFTGDIVPAILGGVLAVMIWDDLFLLPIILACVIIGLCSYYFWADIILQFDKETMLKQMSFTFFYMFSVFIKAVHTFNS